MNILKRLVAVIFIIIWFFFIGMFMITWPVTLILVGGKKISRIEDWLCESDNFPFIKWLDL